MSALVPKVVIASYNVQSAFKVPKGLDLNDESKVKYWGVKWDKLTIHLVDDTVIEVDNSWSEGHDYKYPDDDPQIEDADSYGLDEEVEDVDEAKERMKTKKEAMEAIFATIAKKE